MRGATQWAKLSDELVVLADAKHSWLCRQHPFDLIELPPLPTMQEKVAPLEMRALLVGALTAAIRVHRQTPPVEKEQALESNADQNFLVHYALSLISNWHTTHATPLVMEKAARRFADQGRDTPSALCFEVAQEESGHDVLAKQDLEELGLPAGLLIQKIYPKRAEASIALFHQLADHADPIGVFGYGFALERMALFNSKERIEAIERRLPPGVNATRCLRVHSSVGNDADHVEESIEFMARFSPAERQAIARAVYETALVAFDPSLTESSDTLLSLLDQTKVSEMWSQGAK